MNKSVSPVAIVVDQGVDGVGKGVAEWLRERKRPTQYILAERLALCRLEVTPTRAICDGQVVGSVFFHCHTHANYGADFEEPDQGFASDEVRATWLSILQIPSVLTINQVDAELWYTSAEWAVWRKRLQQAGVPLANVAVGDSKVFSTWSWLPWGGGILGVPGCHVRRAFAPALTEGNAFQQSLWCEGQVFSGPSGKHVAVAGKVMASYGLHLGSILTNQREEVVSCTTACTVPDSLTLEIATRIAEVINAHLCRW
ncbi:MAG: hypothetical protein NPIRA02_04870 [Nitrospirales bacterium]|nr:MAG: hypothetical protein NPIRA02_04870 [Nitrospirales bacterium]